jgi:hypothetical protein
MSNYTFIERADGLKAQAQIRRNKGLHTGKLAKGHDWKRREETNAHEIAAIECLSNLRTTVADLRAQHDWNTRLGAIMGDCNEISF